MADEGHCVRCGNLLETILHTIRECGFSKAIWKAILLNSISSNFFSSDLHDWISQNLESESISTKFGGSGLLNLQSYAGYCGNVGIILSLKNSHSNVDYVVSTSLVWIESLASSRTQAVHRIQTGSNVH